MYKIKKVILISIIILFGVVFTRGITELSIFLTENHYIEISIPLKNKIDISDSRKFRYIIKVYGSGNVQSYFSGTDISQELSGSYRYTLGFKGLPPPTIYNRPGIFQNTSIQKTGVVRVYKSGYQELDRIMINGNIFLQRERHFIETLY